MSREKSLQSPRENLGVQRPLKGKIFWGLGIKHTSYPNELKPL